ncbi:MAG: beta-lactamase family protein [Spirochaetes bacterium]|nr:beta-lactamase family protein [Spirochaetota bacterium]
MNDVIIHLKKTALAVLVISALISCSSAPKRPDAVKKGDYSYAIEHIKWLIGREMSRAKIEGLSIAIIDGQNVVWAEGFGYAVKSRGIKAARDTLYQIGSISKIFTAMAAMKLVEKGKLDIDRPVSHYLKGLAYRKRFTAPEPRVRHLMYHHSGLPSDNLAMLFTRKSSIPFTAMAAALKDEYAAYPPDLVYSYCNLCVNLEGHIIQKVSGRDFISFTDRELFRPMGMTHTSFSNTPSDEALMSMGYLMGEESDRYVINPLPAGSAISSVSDLAEFIKTLNAGGMRGATRVLAEKTLKKMFIKQNTGSPYDFDLGFGLGWFLSGLDFLAKTRINYGGLVAWHAGSTVLFNSMLAVIPDMKIGVVVLSNSNTGSMAVAKIAVESLNRAIEAKTGEISAAAAAPEPAMEGPGESDPGSIEGYYATEYMGAVRIKKSGSGASMEVGGYSMGMTFYGGKKFRLSYFGIRPGIFRDSYFTVEKVSGKTLLVSEIFGRRYLAGTKAERVRAPDSWLKRAGNYSIFDPGDTVQLFGKLRLGFDDGYMLAYYNITGTPEFIPGMILVPLSDTEAVIAGLGRNMGQTIRVVVRDGKEMLYFSGVLLRRED